MDERWVKQQIRQRLSQKDLDVERFSDWWGYICDYFGDDLDEEGDAGLVDLVVDHLSPILQRIQCQPIRAKVHQKALTKAFQEYERYGELNTKLGRYVPAIGVELFTGNHCYHILRFPAHFSRNAVHEIIDNIPFLKAHTKGFALWTFVIECGLTETMESEPVMDDDGQLLGYAVSKTRYRWTEIAKKWNEIAPKAWRYKGKNPGAQIQIEFQRADNAMQQGETVKGLKRAMQHQEALVVAESLQRIQCPTRIQNKMTNTEPE